MTLPRAAHVCAYILMNTRYAPVNREDLLEYGVTSGLLAMRLRSRPTVSVSFAQDRGGEEHWIRPANLFAIWWRNRHATVMSAGNKVEARQHEPTI